MDKRTESEVNLLLATLAIFFLACVVMFVELSSDETWQSDHPGDHYFETKK